MEAPRWRLTADHYLPVKELPDGTRVEWEHKETSKTTGKAVRKLYPVPLLLSTKDPADFNYPGEIIVALEVDGVRNAPQDYIFIGEPTQEMEPLNDEAQAITDRLRPKWINPVEALPINGGMNDAERTFMERMMKAFEQNSPPASAAVVPKEQYDELKARMDRLEAALLAKASGEPTPERRV